jgi:hypothetical protein
MIRATGILQGRILIVEDQEANVLLLEQMLREAHLDAHGPQRRIPSN